MQCAKQCSCSAGRATTQVRQQCKPTGLPQLPQRVAALQMRHNSKRDVSRYSTEQTESSTSAPSASTSSSVADEGLDKDSLTAQKQAEADRLRAAEKFMVVGGGNGTCKSCGYKYEAQKGDPDFPVAKGTKFEELMDDYTCPVCNSPKSAFQSDARVVAGFAENQKYGLGFNSVTGSQKLLVIYGALAIGFILLIGGYAME